MNKRVFSMHYTLTMETEHARDFISCTGCGNFLKQCLQAQAYTKKKKLQELLQSVTVPNTTELCLLTTLTK
jgi:hypothetical protein